MKQNYIVIEDRLLGRLQEKINSLIDEGYQPIGGVSTYIAREGLEPINVWYVQAVTKLLQNNACEDGTNVR